MWCILHTDLKFLTCDSNSKTRGLGGVYEASGMENVEYVAPAKPLGFSGLQMRSWKIRIWSMFPQ